MNEQKHELMNTSLDHVEFIRMWDTIQGEGPYAGMPAIFIRLAGCNLQCPLCDTDYTNNVKTLPVWEVVDRLCERWKPCYRNLVVITGGEPFRQPFVLYELISLLLMRGYRVQVETNGIVASGAKSEMPIVQWENMISRGLTIVCSPKASVVTLPSQLICCWKYVVRAGEIDDSGLPTRVLGRKDRPARPTNNNQIYIQPADEYDVDLNHQNTLAALKSCQMFNFRFSLQIHKYIGVE